jgi:predicted ATPase
MRACSASAKVRGVILTPDQRLRVFVSSTLQELAAERAAVRDAIAGLQLTPVLFELGARPHPPQALYRAYLEQSHVFVGIYGESYGWVAPGASISGIEDEYQLSHDLPRLLYVKEPAPEREPRLYGLLQRVEAEGAVAYKPYATASELAGLVAQDVALLLAERFHVAAEPSPAAAPRTLPAPRTSFVGRSLELARLEELIASGTRLVTLTGPGGVGKTRLAVEVARRLAGRFPDGVVFVALDGVDRAELVPAAIAEALGVRELADDPASAVGAYLRARRLLLVIDNFEHVVGAAPVVTSLLEASRDLTALVTSRELLRVSGERELPVQPLTVEADAVELFGERAADAGHPIASAGSPVVTEICRRLEGVPLAIELAAPRLRVLTPEQLLERLSSRVSLQGPRDAPARQRTLEAAIAWSYELLAPEEQRLFRCLGVFPGSFTIEAAEAVAGVPDVVDLLASLVDKSIVYRAPHLGETRFALLRMIREFAFARLEETGELESALQRFGAHYRELALGAEEGLRSAAQRQWKQALDSEADNVRAALSWAADGDRSADLALLLRGFFLWFWLHGNLDEIRHWASRGLAMESVLVRDRGWLLHLDGTFGMLQGDFAAAADQLPAAEALLVEAGDEWGVAMVRLVLAYASAPFTGEAQAHAALAEALAALEQLGDLWGVTTVRHMMCRLRVIYGRFEDAGDVFERALAAAEELGDELAVALSLINLACARLAGDSPMEARRFIRRSLEHMREAGIAYASADVLDVLAQIEHADGRYEPAAELLGAADALRVRLHSPLWGPAVERHERLVEELRDSLGEAAFHERYDVGQALAPGDANDLAVRIAAVPAAVSG